MKALKSIHFCSDGRILAVDQNGKIIPEISEKNVLEFWAQYIRSLGYELEDVPVITSDKSFFINCIDNNKFELIPK